MPALAGIFGPFPGTPPTDIGPQAGGGLQQCPKTPNCFSSSAPTADSHYVAPFPYSKSQADAVADVKAIIASYPTDMGECASARICGAFPSDAMPAPLSTLCALARSRHTETPVATYRIHRSILRIHRWRRALGAPTSTPVKLARGCASQPHGLKSVQSPP